MTHITPGPSRRPSSLNISELLFWVFGCALGVAAYQNLLPMTQMPVKTRGWSWAYNLVMGAAFGTFLAGSAILAYRRWRQDRRSSWLPGHWLLLFGAVAAMADGAAAALFYMKLASLGASDRAHPIYWLPYRLSRYPDLPGLYHQSAGWALGASVALAFCWRLQDRIGRPWLAVFTSFFVTALVLADGSIVVTILFFAPLSPNWEPALFWLRCAVHVFAGFAVLGSCLIVAAAALDFRRRKPTDPLHWAGVTAWLAIAAIQLAVYAMFMM